MKKEVKVIDFTKYQQRVYSIGAVVAFLFLIGAFVLLAFAELSVTEIQRITNVAYAAVLFAFFNLLFSALMFDKMIERVRKLENEKNKDTVWESQ